MERVPSLEPSTIDNNKYLADHRDAGLGPGEDLAKFRHLLLKVIDHENFDTI
jgi:hypothetical protein